MTAVLVTGGMGSIGSWVTRKLIERGDRVVTYQRRPETVLLKDILDKFTAISGDVLDLPTLLHTIKQYQIERIIHLAGLVSPPLEANPYMGYRVNVDGTINILEACRLMGIKRLVYSSTKSVYDTIKGEYAHPTYQPISEDYPKAPKTVYGTTKLFGENMCFNYQRIYGVDFIVLRFGGVYGPAKITRHSVMGLGGPAAHDTWVRMVESALLGRNMKVPQGGDQADDEVYHKDIADGIVAACYAEKPEHRFFHLGTGRGITLRQGAEVINRIFQKNLIEVGPGVHSIPGSNPCIFDLSRARKGLGYQPKYDFEAGVRDYIYEMKRLDIKPVLPE